MILYVDSKYKCWRYGPDPATSKKAWLSNTGLNTDLIILIFVGYGVQQRQIVMDSKYIFQ